MAARVGVSREDVVATAMDIVDREGVAALSLVRVAKSLGIRTPSLYAHVDGQGGLLRALWCHAAEDFGEALHAAVAGRTGDQALFGFAAGFRNYALRKPHRYELVMNWPETWDDETRAAIRKGNQAYFDVVGSLGLDRVQAMHAGRTLRAAIHGFVELESNDVLGRENVDDSFVYLISMLAAGLRNPTFRAGRAKSLT